MKMYYVEGEVHKQLASGGYRVKAKILDDNIAMYINGMIVFAPSDKHPDWTVYTPRAGNARIVEFAKNSPLWQEIQEACIDAVKLEDTYQPRDEVPGVEALDNLSGEKFQEQFKKQLDALPF